MTNERLRLRIDIATTIYVEYSDCSIIQNLKELKNFGEEWRKI